MPGVWGLQQNKKKYDTQYLREQDITFLEKGGKHEEEEKEEKEKFEGRRR